MKGNRLIVSFALVLLLMCQSQYVFAITTFSFNSSTGAFSLATAVDGQILSFIGTLEGTDISGTVALSGQSAAFTVATSEASPGRSVTVVLADHGTVTYFLNETLGTTTFTSSTIPPGECLSVAADPLFVALHHAWNDLMIANRQWELSPEKVRIERSIKGLLLYLLGGAFITDCQSVVKPNDTWGCDGLHSLDCTSLGSCCDSHDGCYAVHGCTAASWFRGSLDCIACNASAVACFSSGGSGPSECCEIGCCGMQRASGQSNLAPSLW